jgi:AcrR family transcriptional regulator
VREAVFAASLAELADVGWGSLSVERIADRSGVHKTTIYRRWGTADQVVLEALLERGSAKIPVPDTGDVTRDMIALGQLIAANISAPIGRSIAAAAIEAADSSSIRQIADAFWSERFEQAGIIVGRAIERGQLPGGTESTDLVETVAARIWFRIMVNRLPVSDPWLSEVVDSAVEALRNPNSIGAEISEILSS